MAKAKPKSTMMVPDHTGKLVPVVDRRFEPAADWPIRFEVPNVDTQVWLRYFYAESGKRGWSSGGIGQLEARENSGSVTIQTGGAEMPQLAVVWEWTRGGTIKVRARSSGSVEFAIADAEEFLNQVNERCRARATERFYRRGQLFYDGLAWRGELWLDHTVRLGPPTKQYEDALCGPRVILVDLLIDCAGRSDLARAFSEKVEELSAFLSVAIGTVVDVPKVQQVWTFETGANDCKVRSMGYFESDNPREMPARGKVKATPMKLVTRPDFSLRGIDASTSEESVPSDITDLWNAFSALDSDQRRQFLQAATKFKEALTHWCEEPTLSFALMVVACEALKPAGQGFQEHNLYHVVDDLLGTSTAEQLRKSEIRPQHVRSVHLHRGEFRASEFIRDMMSSYRDPTFDQTHRELARITQESLIEWLLCRGTLTLQPIKRSPTWRRWVKNHVFFVIIAVGALGLVVGLAGGWILSGI